MADGAAKLDETCDKLCDAMKKMAEQELGKEDMVPFLDNLDLGSDKNADVEEAVEDLFDTSSYNEKWETAFSDENSGTGDEIKPRASVAYLAAWKKAMLKFYSRNSDVEAVFGGGVEFINTSAQSIEATRLVLSDTAEESSK